MNRQNIILAASAGLATALAMLAVPALGQLVSQVAPPAAVAPLQANPEPAPQEIVPLTQAGLQQSFAPVVRRTAPAVVNVYSSVSVTRFLAATDCVMASESFICTPMTLTSGRTALM